MVSVDRSLWEAVTGAPSSWFDWLLDIFVPNLIKASDLCALNLADPSLPSVADLAGAFLRDPSSILVVWAYVRDKLRYVAFTNACVCNAGTGPPTCIAIPTRAGGGTAYTTGTFTYGVGFKVTVPDITCTGIYLDGMTGGFAGGTTVYLWNLGGVLVHSEAVTLTGAIPQTIIWSGGGIPLTNGSSYVVGINKGPGDPWHYWLMANVSDNAYMHPLWGGASSPSGTFGYPTDQTEPWWGMAPVLCQSPQPTTPVAPVQPAQPPTLTLPPNWACSTIGDLCVRLREMERKLDWLVRGIPTVQTSSVAESTVHAGLTGSGSISVSGIVGFKLTLTTVPASYGTEVGNPPTKWGVARVAVLTAEGMRSQAWYGAQSEVMVGPDTTTLDYYFAPGVVATITELKRGP